MMGEVTCVRCGRRRRESANCVTMSRLVSSDIGVGFLQLGGFIVRRFLSKPMPGKEPK